MADPESGTATLKTLRGLGVGVAIENFGTAPTALVTLGSLPVTTLTIDRALVGACDTDYKAMAIVTAVVGLAHDLGLRVVSEGVETAAQAEALRAVECDLAQGFYFGRPVTAEALLASLDKGARGVTGAAPGVPPSRVWRSPGA